jgi:hypothetical protein
MSQLAGFRIIPILICRRLETGRQLSRMSTRILEDDMPKLEL